MRIPQHGGFPQTWWYFISETSNPIPVENRPKIQDVTHFFRFPLKSRNLKTKGD